MESIQRQIMLLRPGDGPNSHPQSRATLKLQAGQAGLAVLLTVSSLPAGSYSLYLFLQDGAAIYAGDVSSTTVRQTLPGIRLQSVWGAAVIQDTTHVFSLKSTGVDWAEVSARFKLIHAPRPTSPIIQPAASDITPIQKVAPPQPAVNPEPSVHAAPVPRMSPAPSSKNDDVSVNAEVSHAPRMSPDEPSVYTNFNDAEPNDAMPPRMSPSYPASDETDVPELHDEPYTPQQPDDMDIDDDEINACDACPQSARQEQISPFPAIFPQSEWIKISYPGPVGWWHYITGRIFNGSKVVAKAVGVPGEYGMAPPVWLDGFGTYLRCVTQDAHGYWLMFQDAETGEILDMELSPRGA